MYSLTTLFLYNQISSSVVSLFSLGQLASMAGIDRSDLQPARGAQPSCTVGSHLGDGDLLNRVGYRDVGTRTDPVSLVRA